MQGHEHDAVAAGHADHPIEVFGAHREGDDGVEAPVDEVLDGTQLRCRVRAGRDHPKVGEVLVDAFRLHESLGGLDHLDPPGVADEAIDQGDPIRPFARVPLEVPGVLGSGRKALRQVAKPLRRPLAQRWRWTARSWRLRPR